MTEYIINDFKIFYIILPALSGRPAIASNILSIVRPAFLSASVAFGSLFSPLKTS